MSLSTEVLFLGGGQDGLKARRLHAVQRVTRVCCVDLLVESILDASMIQSWNSCQLWGRGGLP